MECFVVTSDLLSNSKVVEYKFEAQDLQLELGQTNRLLDAQPSSDSSSSQDSVREANRYVLEWSFKNTTTVSTLAEAGPNAKVIWQEPLQLRAGLYFQASRNGRINSNQVSRLSVKMHMRSGHFKVMGTSIIDFGAVPLDNKEGCKLQLSVGSVLHPDARVVLVLVPTRLTQDNSVRRPRFDFQCLSYEDHLNPKKLPAAGKSVTRTKIAHGKSPSSVSYLQRLGIRSGKGQLAESEDDARRLANELDRAREVVNELNQARKYISVLKNELEAVQQSKHESARNDDDGDIASEIAGGASNPDQHSFSDGMLRRKINRLKKQCNAMKIEKSKLVMRIADLESDLTSLTIESYCASDEDDTEELRKSLKETKSQLNDEILCNLKLQNMLAEQSAMLETAFESQRVSAEELIILRELRKRDETAKKRISSLIKDRSRNQLRIAELERALSRAATHSEKVDSLQLELDEARSLIDRHLDLQDESTASTHPRWRSFGLITNQLTSIHELMHPGEDPESSEGNRAEAIKRTTAAESRASRLSRRYAKAALILGESVETLEL